MSTTTRIFEKVTCNLAGKARRRKYGGEWYLVSPMVIIPEGVMNGSHGPGLYLEKELLKTPVMWNNKPITLNHPEEGTANDIKVLEDSKIGFVLNAHVRGKKLRAEAWVNEKRTTELAPEIVKYMKSGKAVEVSSGLHLDQEIKNGTYKRTGKRYDWIARNHQPDHIAVFDPLSGEVGAASVKDGAGLNVSNISAKMNPNRKAMRRMTGKLIANLGGKLVKNELSFSAKTCELSDQLSSKFGEPGKYWQGWITDVYNGYVVFYNGGTLYKMNYTETGDTVTLTGEAVEVERTVQYVTVNGLRFIEDGRSLLPQKETEMSTKVQGQKKTKATVNELITNGGYEETDREWLEALDEKALSKVRPVANQVNEDTQVEEDEDEEPVVNTGKKVLVKNKKGTETETPAKKPNLEESLASLHPDLQRTLRRTLNRESKQKEVLIKKLVKNGFNEKFLQKQDVDDLQNLLITLNKAAGKRQRDEEEDEEGMFVSNSSDDDDEGEEDDEEADGYEDGALAFVGAGAPVVNNRRRARDPELEGDGVVLPVMTFEKRGK